MFLQNVSTSFAWPYKPWNSTKTRLIGHPGQVLADKGIYAIKFVGEIQNNCNERDSCDKPGQSNVSNIQKVLQPSTETPGGSGRATKTIPGEIVKFAYSNATYPINAIYQTRQWQNSRFKYTLPTENVFIRAMQCIQTSLTHYTYNDYLNLYATIKPQWCAVNRSFDNYYLTIKESKCKPVSS